MDEGVECGGKAPPLVRKQLLGWVKKAGKDKMDGREMAE
jgi:hypothetical protein